MTLEGIAAEELRRVEMAEERLGQAFLVSQEATFLLSNFIEGISADREVFIRSFALLKKHHTLAVLSALRGHHDQAVMNLRYVIEAASSAAYALAQPRGEFVDPDTGLSIEAQKTRERAYKWVAEAFPSHSADLKGIKDALSQTGAHFNLVNSARIVTEQAENGFRRTEFFDLPDQHLEEVNLWQITGVAIATMHLLDQVATAHGGFTTAATFHDRGNLLTRDWQAMRDRLTATERHQAATAKADEAEAKKEAARAAPAPKPKAD
jgi:hypothetical protein